MADDRWPSVASSKRFLPDRSPRRLTRQHGTRNGSHRHIVNATFSLTNTDTNTANTLQNPQKYSDQETFTVSVPNTTINGLTATTAGTTVTFYVGTQNMGTCTLTNSDAANSCAVTTALVEPSATAAGAPTGSAANGQMLPGSHAVTATYTVNLPYFNVTWNSATLNMAPESAIATFSGDTFYGTGTGTSATIILSATIQDPAAVASVDPASGDIRNAVVTFIDRNSGAVLCAKLPVGLVSTSSGSLLRVKETRLEIVVW